MDSSRVSSALILVVIVIIGASAGAAGAMALTAFFDVPVSGSTSLQAPDGMNATIVGSANHNMTSNFPTSGSVEYLTDKGNITFYSPGNASGTVHVSEITGTWTNVTNIVADPNTVQITPGDKSAIVVGQEITSISYKATRQADDGTVDFAYTSSGGPGRLTIQGLAASTDLYAIDASTNNILDSATSGSGGTVTFDSLSSGTHDVVIQANVNNAPTFSNPRPTGNVDSTFSSIKIDVNDSNFPQGDSVTAELFVDGTSQGTDTLSSNGTASVPFSPDLGETYTYNWTATDQYGGVTDSATYTVSTPSNITIRQETNASSIVRGANATITLYSADATVVVSRSDDNDDGNISLTGLPDKEFVAVVEADGYYTRRVYIESIYEQQDIFILNSTDVPPTRAINTTFVFEDRTGNFNPENTTLRIQRAIDVNNDSTYDWMTIAGDYWGAASEFPFTGQQNARYRLIVENQEGQRRILGTHIPTESGIKTIINGEIRFNAGNATGRYWDANLSTDPSNIQVLYQDPTNGTGDIRVRVWELGNKSNVIHDQNYTATPYGELLATIDLTDEQAKSSWIVKIDAQHDSDGAIDARIPVGGMGILLPMDLWLLGAFGVIGVTFVATLYGPRTATGGAWMLVLAAMGLTAFGWVGFPVAGLIIAAAIAAAGTFYKEALP